MSSEVIPVLRVARPDGLIYLTVSDVAALARTLDAEVVEQPWGPEVHLTDPDGNRVRVGIAPG